MSGADDKPAHAPRLYLRRRGRRTRAQARALDTLAPRYCLEPGAPIEPAAVFGRAAPFGVEIGFGMGQALIDWALACPDWNLLGVEVYEPGIGSALLGIERHGLGNVRLVEGDAEQVLERCLAPDSVDEVRIFFPDPWPKKRHHKRRLVQPAFVALLARRLRPGGLVWLATDWEEYAQWIAAVFDAETAFEALRPPQVESDQPDAERPRTRFEARGRRLGHAVWDLRYVRKR
ncbi:MAG TPA: tRNA (guanosine(46)-N7)-methyltransferase TrmB [Pseudomonadales bacterium]